MSTLTYTPDEDVKVHEEGAIRLICRAYQSHEDGLPELLKNSADAYAREDAPEAKRVIVVIFDHGHKDRRSSISCVDFSGMTSQVIEDNFRIWADPEAARRGSKAAQIQGGHGNGGKCYMTQMFDDFAVIRTVRSRLGNRYGVVAGSVKFGYVPDRARGRDFPVADLRNELDRVLGAVGCSIRSLPPGAHEALKLADGFTLVTGVGPKGHGQKIPVSQLISNLQEHPQTMRTLELCKVFVIVNGQLHSAGAQLTLPGIPPIEGAEKARILPIPEGLTDPVADQDVSTTAEGKLPAGTLILRTSNVSMRWSRKSRHVIIYKAESGYIGYDLVSSYDVESPYRDRIYGECVLESLEPYKQNDRSALAKSPLTRALRALIAKKIEEYAKEFEARDRQRYRQEESNTISRMNEALDRWKNRFLRELMKGLWGPGGDGSHDRERNALPSGRPVKMDLTFSYPRAGRGVAFRPSLGFYDEAGREIRSVPYKWMSDDNNIAMVDEDLMVINTFSYGKTGIYAETLDGKLKSNKVPLEVVRIEEIRIVPPEVEVSAGSRYKLQAVCRLTSGDETSEVYLEWVENDSNVARVSSAGLVYAFSPGQTEVYAMDDKCTSGSAVVRVAVSEGRDKGGRKGRGFPRVLVSGEFDRDPETNEYVHFSRDDPPVYQRPQDVDRNIWWINSAAPLARLYLDTSKDYGYQSREWRMYHLERYVDVIVQIALTHGPQEVGSMSVHEWILKWGARASEIQAAAVSDLASFISVGQLPTD